MMVDFRNHTGPNRPVCLFTHGLKLITGGISTFMYNVETVTPATVSPISTTDMAASLRLNTTAENTLLASRILAAADLFSRETGYVLTSTTLRLNLDGWPSAGIVYIPRTPVTTVSSVQYRDTEGDWQTVSADDYIVDTTSTPARVIFATSFTFPDLHETERPAVRVQFVAGHATAAAVPPAAVLAVDAMVQHWYKNRATTSEVDLKETPFGWRTIVGHFHTGVLGDNWNV